MQQSPLKLKGLLTGILALGAVVASVHSASAQTFAQFSQQNANTQAFAFTNTGNGAATFTANTAVYFIYNGTNFVPATLTFSGTASGAAVQTATSLRQNLSTATLTISAGGINYLTATGTGFLVGDNSTGTTSASFQASQTGTPPDSLIFTSDVIAGLPISFNRNYSIALSGLTGGFVIDGANQLASFQASGTGTFAATIPVVPEPGTVAGMVALGGSMCGLIVRARRRTVKPNATAAVA